MLYIGWFMIFFFKQKTAYEMRISDWSSDVCSSDLHDMRLDRDVAAQLGIVGEPHAFGVDQGGALLERSLAPPPLPLELEMGELGATVDAGGLVRKIGRASCWERVCPSG